MDAREGYDDVRLGEFERQHAATGVDADNAYHSQNPVRPRYTGDGVSCPFARVNENFTRLSPSAAKNAPARAKDTPMNQLLEEPIFQTKNQRKERNKSICTNRTLLLYRCGRDAFSSDLKSGAKEKKRKEERVLGILVFIHT